jgi:hypothetical protein
LSRDLNKCLKTIKSSGLLTGENIRKRIGAKKYGEGTNTNGAIHCGRSGPAPTISYFCRAEGDTLQQKAMGAHDVTLFVLWIPMGWYLIFVVGPSSNVNPQHVVRAGALNLGIGVPLFILIGRMILKVRK